MKLVITVFTIISLLGYQGRSGVDSPINRLIVTNENVKESEVQNPATKETYKLITKNNPNIDTLVIKKLTEPLKGLAAFYAAMGGTGCDGKNCKLTTGLGLGKQGSEQHKNLIKKYFPNDNVAEKVLKDECYMAPNNASIYSEYKYLTITNLGDTVKVDYNLVFYNKENQDWIKGPDIYLFKDNTFLNLKRNLFTNYDLKQTKTNPQNPQ